MSFIVIGFIRILNIYQIIILFYVLSSWFPSVRSSAVGRFIGSVTEPYLSIFRKIIPPLGMVDISALIAVWVLNMAISGLHRLV